MDDASDRAFLMGPLEEHLRGVERETGVPARVVRTQARSGLVQARLKGAAEAKGKALVFLVSAVIFCCRYFLFSFCWR